MANFIPGNKQTLQIDSYTLDADGEVGIRTIFSQPGSGEPQLILSDLQRAAFTLDADGEVAVRVVSPTGGELDADNIVTNNRGSDIVRTSSGNVISVRFGD